jgi:uncharacterized protein YkwD
MRAPALVLTLAFLLGACATMPEPHHEVAGVVVPAASPAPPDPQTQMRPLEDRVYALVENERLKLDPASKVLLLDPVLMDVARKRAVDMAAHGYFADNAPDGTTSASLVMAEDARFQGLLGVNIAAQHYTKQSGVDVNAFAQRFLDTWLKSPSHKDNLAFTDYNRTGIGCAANGDTVFVTQLFATDLGLPPPKDGAPPGQITSEASPRAAKSAMQPKSAPALRNSEGAQ